MATTEKSRLELVEAVATLGGQLHAAKRSGVPRVTLIYWMKHGWPYYRQHEVDTVLELARKSELATLERLTRKYQWVTAEKLERARHLVLDAHERKRRKAAK